MVGYGELLLFVTDIPIVQSEFLFNSIDSLKVPKRYKLFQDYKNAWLEWMILHGNDDVDDEEFYETHNAILLIKPYSMPIHDVMNKMSMSRLPLELADIFSAKFVYCLDGGNFSFFYDTNFDYSHYEIREQKICPLREECSTELFGWLMDYMRERFDKGSKVNKLAYCYGRAENLNEGYGTVNIDLDSIEVPNDSYKFFHKEAMKAGVDLSESENGFIVNFYKGSSK